MPELSSFMDYVGFGKSLKVLKSKIEGFVKRNAEVGRVKGFASRDWWGEVVEIGGLGLMGRG